MSSECNISDQTSSLTENSTARYAWAGYYMFVLTSSFLGDPIILIAAIKYRALKIHKSVVIIIQHIAACDILTDDITTNENMEPF